jgi:hypothetical protein
MDNFAQILIQLLATMEEASIRNHFGSVIPFKVQVNFDIPLFEGHMYSQHVRKMVKSARALFIYLQFFQQ